MKYTKKDILDQLDQCADGFTFPMLDNGYVYLVDTRLSAYRDENRWVLLIEVVGFNYRGGGHNGITNCLHLFGNCLSIPPGTNNDNFIYITDNSSEGSTFDEEYMESLNPEVNTFLIRGKEIKINHSPSYYASKEIELEQSPKIKVWEFLRGIVPEYRSDLLATEEEIRSRIPRDIPLILTLDEWNHPDLVNGETPGGNETFQMIAEVLEKGNAQLYKPTQKPNTHWKNWPEGGTL